MSVVGPGILERKSFCNPGESQCTCKHKNGEPMIWRFQNNYLGPVSSLKCLVTQTCSMPGYLCIYVVPYSRIDLEVSGI